MHPGPGSYQTQGKAAFNQQMTGAKPAALTCSVRYSNTGFWAIDQIQLRRVFRVPMQPDAFMPGGGGASGQQLKFCQLPDKSRVAPRPPQGQARQIAKRMHY